jgi:hypothetical protein
MKEVLGRDKTGHVRFFKCYNVHEEKGNSVINNFVQNLLYYKHQKRYICEEYSQIFAWSPYL